MQTGLCGTILFMMAGLFLGISTNIVPSSEVDTTNTNSQLIKEIWIPANTPIYSQPGDNIINHTPENLFWISIGTDTTQMWVYGFYLLDDRVAMKGWIERENETLPVLTGDDIDLRQSQALSTLVPDTDLRQ